MRRLIELTKKVLVVTSIACIGTTISIRSNAGRIVGMADVAATYKSKCAKCHGADGNGQTTIGKSMKLRDLRSTAVQNQSDAQLYQIIAKGKGKMPGYEKILGGDTCKALTAFMRQLGEK